MSPFREIFGRRLSDSDRKIRKIRDLKPRDLVRIGNIGVYVLDDNHLFVGRDGFASPAWTGSFDEENGFVKDEVNAVKKNPIDRRSIYMEGQENMIEWREAERLEK